MIFPAPPRRRAAFSLIELLVTMAVLAILAIIVSQMVGSTGGAIRQSKKTVDAAGQAQAVFDAISRDLANMVARSDVPIAPTHTNGALPDLMFLTETQAPTEEFQTTRTVSLAGYRLDPERGLERFLRPARWHGGSFFGYEDFSNPSMGYLLPDDEDFDVLAPGLIAMSVRFLNRIPGGNDPDGVELTDAWQGLGTTLGMIVTLAVLDRESLQLLEDGPGMLADAFEEADVATTPFADWAGVADGVAAEEVPLPAATSVRVFERFFLMPAAPLHTALQTPATP